MQLLATDFPCSLADAILDRAPSYPVFVHNYGQPMPTCTDVHWMSYARHYGENTIMFLKHIHLDFPEFTEYVLNYMMSLIDYPLQARYLTLICTNGSVRPHVDEGRRCSINIGLRNSSLARTFTSHSKTVRTWKSEAVETVCQDGHAYLLDTGSLHSVLSDDPTSRYLVTYGFYEEYETILKLRRPNVTSGDLH